MIRVAAAGVLLTLASFSGSLAQFSFQEAFPGMSTFSFPVELVNAGDGSNRLFVLEQRGLIYVIYTTPGTTTRKVFLDLRDRVSQSGGETGLLGLAFHPSYSTNGYFYVDYTNFGPESVRAVRWMLRDRAPASPPGGGGH